MGPGFAHDAVRSGEHHRNEDSALQYEIRSDSERTVALAPGSEDVLVEFLPNEWESRFFDHRIGTLRVPEDIVGGVADPETFRQALARLLETCDRDGVELIEHRLDIEDFDRVSLMEDEGFRLVDSRITFMTSMEKASFAFHEPATGCIRWAAPADLPAIQELTRAGFSRNPAFRSRFKNPRYYSPGDAERYYAEWIANHLGHPDSLFVVIEHRGRPVGYYIYKRGASHEGLPVLKGILSALEPEYRGQRAQLAMQSFIYDSLEWERWYVDNTTQLTNYPVMKNHIRFGKKLQQITLVFYRERGVGAGD
jgi:hypothetical protein